MEGKALIPDPAHSSESSLHPLASQTCSRTESQVTSHFRAFPESCPWVLSIRAFQIESHASFVGCEIYLLGHKQSRESGIET